MADTTVYPYSAIVRVTDSIGGTAYDGSGVLIAPDEVLTASHLVYRQGVGTATDITVSPGYDAGLALLGTFDGVATHWNPIEDGLGFISQPDTAQDFAVIHLAAPVPSTVGFMGLGTDYGNGTVTVSGYPGYVGNQVNQTEGVSTIPGANILTGGGIGAGSSGGPVWIGGPQGATVYGLVSSGNVFTNTGYFNKITADEAATIRSWVQEDEAAAGAPAPALVAWNDTTAHQSGTTAMAPSAGGPAYLQHQYIWAGDDGVAISTDAPNVFIRGGPGSDAIRVASGQNVLDGGTGSNFLTGGTGTDTFFTDARTGAEVWNTVVNFHSGEYATLWGFTAGVSSFRWDVTPSGVAGYTGATLRANIVGGAGRTGTGIDASITFAGLSLDQARHLQIATGTQPAGTYLLLYNPGV